MEIPQPAAGAAAEGGEGEWRVPEEEIARRRDLRDGAHFMCSIDPPGSKDVDDVLSTAHLPNGLIQVGLLQVFLQVGQFQVFARFYWWDSLLEMFRFVGSFLPPHPTAPQRKGNF
ncbi:unnamed protein product [Closterium sp. NIES-53]